jgi:hypothetical protein
MEAICSCETLASLRYTTQQLDWQTRDYSIFAKQLKVYARGEMVCGGIHVAREDVGKGGFPA